MARKPAFIHLLATCAALLFAAVVCSLLLGSAAISVPDLWSAAFGKGDPAVQRVLLHVRLPRTAGALLAGCALSAAGVVIQSVLSNPLAGPNLIGVNAGAGLGAVLCSAFLPGVARVLPVAAFLGALGAMLLIYSIARLTGASRFTLILAGIAIGSILSACIDAVVTIVPDALVSVNAFRIGSLSGVTFQSLVVPCGFIVLAIAALFALGNEQDVLALGDETAASLGLNIKLYRFLFLFVAAVLCGAAVSFAGLLGFVGLIVPHAARFLAGSETRRLLPVSVLAGGTFVIVCDILARVLFAPYELPVGIVMSFVGGPFFLWLLIRRKGGHTGHD
jgi:iron complex transport system permease protein